MSSSQKIPFGIPASIGRVESQPLDNLADRFPERVYLATHKHLQRPESEFTQAERDDIKKILNPVHELVNQYFLDAYGYPPYEIVTDFDTRTVEPQEAQRGGAWHRDQNRASAIILISSQLTTRYLIGNNLNARESTYWSKRILDIPSFKNKTDVNQNAITDGLQSRRLRVYQPDRYAVTISDNYVHQSATNRSGRALEKTWLRLFVFDHYR